MGQNRQRFKSIIFSLILFLLLLHVTCVEKHNGLYHIPMRWVPADSLNVKLPKGIRLYAGRNDSLPLRAGYVTIEEKRPEIITKVVVSDDTTDHRQSVSSFARGLDACVVVNGGYFTMNRIPAEHVGLLISDGNWIAQATERVLRDSIQYETARAALGFSGEDIIDISWATTRFDCDGRRWTPGEKPGCEPRRIGWTHAPSWCF